MYSRPTAAGRGPPSPFLLLVAWLNPPAIPQPGPLGQPKSPKQVGAPADATRAAIPFDNPQTPEKIALGQKLFFDGRLSADGTVACSTCHDPARAFTETPVPTATSAMR